MTSVPQGKIIRRLHGGPEALKTLLRDLKRYAFTGYVSTRVEHEGKSAEGVLAVKAGELQIALRSQGADTLRGNAALKEVWSDSRRAECAIELHGKVDVDALVRHLGDAVVERPERAANRPKTAGPPRHEAGTGPADQVRAWKAAGFDTREIESKLAEDPLAARAAVVEFARGVGRSLALQQVLDRLDRAGIENKASEIRGKLRDLRHLTLAEAEIANLQAEQEAATVPVPRAPATIRVVPLSEPVRPAPGVAARIAASAEAPSMVRFESEPAEAAAPRDERTNLIRRYVFDSFVVGPSNRFAHAAALAMARSTRTAYNPLFITSGSGMGKTHLLNAVGNAVSVARPDARVAYLSAEVFANEFRQAKATDKLPDFRGKYRSVDLFLLDDVHFLSGQGDVQEELFHTFDELTGAGKQIVLTSDRPPKDIPDLEDRLVSRFESGLVADIQAPELETRMAILRRRAAEVGGVPDDVLAAIAGAVSTNVRELGGALNQVTAHASLLGQPVTLALATEVLEDLKASPGDRSGDPDLLPGRAYLVEEARPSACFRLFSRVAGADGGLLITRTNPKWVRERYELGRAAVLWLTDHEGAAERTIAPQLERLMYEILLHLETSGRGAILIDGIEYLVSNATFDAVLKFLRALVDAVSESSVVLLVSLSAETLEDQEIKTLERELEVLSVT